MWANSWITSQRQQRDRVDQLMNGIMPSPAIFSLSSACPWAGENHVDSSGSAVDLELGGVPPKPCSQVSMPELACQ